MSEPEPAGWDPSFSEALWRDGPSQDRRLHEAVDRLADHMDRLWGRSRPEPELDLSGGLREAVWGPQARPERAEREPAMAVPGLDLAEDAPPRGPEQLTLFDLPADGRRDPTPG